MIGSLLLLVASLGQTAEAPSISVDRSSVTVYTDQSVQISYVNGGIKISWTAPTPGPGPIPPVPPPTPIDPPVVTTQNPLWAIAVVDKSQVLPSGQAAIRDSKTIAPRLKELNAEWRCYDVKDPLFAAWAKDAPPAPGLLLIEVKPDVVVKFSASALPADETGVLTAVKRARGKL